MLTSNIISAAQQGHLSTVKMLVAKGAIQSKDHLGQTPLAAAAWMGHEEIAKLLIDSGAEIESADKYNNSALFTAARYGNIGIVKRLLDRGAMVYHVANSGQTPLHLASWIAHTEIVQLLLDNGAISNAKDNSGWTPLHYASMDPHTGTIQLLMDNGALTDAKDNQGYTPLHFATDTMLGLKSVELLVMKGGADVNVQATDGRNPLAVAAVQGYQDIVRFLLAHGANPNPETDYSPLAMAAEMKCEEVVKILIANGADPNAKTRKGVTPLQNAEAVHLERCRDLPCGHESIFRLLRPLTTVSVPPSVQEEEENERESNELGNSGTEGSEKPVSVGERDGRAEESL